ncbi:5'-methylthioadenosine nucleosidase [Sphingomonas sp. Leaf67]|nr:5'-methylthioadenosine nucleosidase [Sphingomonas sp. Leaf67]
MQVTRIGGRRVLFVMATDHEYGPCLAERFVPVITGVGPVEAAIGTTQALAGMTDLPDLVVSIGSAGSRRLPLGSIWQVASVSWRDMDATRIGVPKGVTPFADHPAELPLATPLDWPVARLSTGADIVGGDAYDAIDAELVDMETFAVLRACGRFGVPVMGLRGVSDGPGELEALGGWTAMLGVLDERLAVAVDLLR